VAKTFQKPLAQSVVCEGSVQATPDFLFCNQGVRGSSPLRGTVFFQ
jgi:hypothetical protein